MIQQDNNEQVIQKAPACFGSVSCFARDSEHCKQCVAYSECEKQSYQTLISIKNIVNVDDLIRKHEKARIAQQAKREQERKALEKAKSEPMKYGQPKMPTVVERATKVEKVTFEVTQLEEEVVLKLPVKAQPFALTLLKTGMIHDIREGVKKGTNAIADKKPMWLVKTIDLLVKGGFSRAELKSHLMAELGWSDNSAGAHVSLAIAILCSFSIAQETSGRIVAMP